MTTDKARYDTIGHGYASHRREDPFIAAKIHTALGDAHSVVNVGAGAGSYEPSDRLVIPVEPSEVMSRQRNPRTVPAIRARADSIPLHDKSVDAAMTVLSLHHWDPHQQAGVWEMLRIARKRIVIITIDPRISAEMWLMKDYLHEVAELDNRIFPRPEAICDWIGPQACIDIIPIRRDSPDRSLVSFWAHPERVLDDGARAATSGFARQTPAVNQRVVDAVRRDLASGAWDKKYGSLRNLQDYDAGLRLISASLSHTSMLS